ncbi:MAG: DUF4350 domain-containing protein [Gammaproteobacteria bacterium]|nr:DUF4350 domain-containing protein [Gammaproteobacteria bacterium]
MANRLFIGFLLLLLLALLAWGGHWFLENFERQTKEIRSGYSEAARRNPLLAAERFLQRLDLQVESLSGRERLKSPPPESGVLFVKDLGPSLPPAQEAGLLEWIEGGGHLIAGLSHVPDEDAAQNHLLETLGIHLVERPSEDQPDADSPLEFVMPEVAEPIQVSFDASRVLRTERDDMRWAVPAGQDFHLLRLAWGTGRITLLSDNRFFNNAAIDQYDHALLLAGLMQGHERVWLLYSSQMPALWQIAWRLAPQLIISGSVLLAMLLWWLSYRSGPILLQGNPQRRSLLEHLQAAAEFRWRQDRAVGLLESTRRQLEHRWLLSHPALQTMDRPERCRWLAERTGLSALSIEAALYAEQRQDAGLIENSVIQQRLLTALHPDKQRKDL